MLLSSQGWTLPDKCVLTSDSSNNVTLDCSGNHSTGISDSDTVTGTKPSSLGTVTINLRNLTHDIAPTTSNGIIFYYDPTATGNIILNNQIHESNPRSIISSRAGIVLYGSTGSVSLYNDGNVTTTVASRRAIDLSSPLGASLFNEATITASKGGSIAVELSRGGGTGAINFTNRGSVIADGDGSRTVFISSAAKAKTATKAKSIIIRNEIGAIIRAHGDFGFNVNAEAVHIPNLRPFETVLVDNAGTIEAIGSGASAVDIYALNTVGDAFIVTNKSGGIIKTSGDLYRSRNSIYDANAVNISTTNSEIPITITNGEAAAAKTSSIIATGTGARAIYVRAESSAAGKDMIIRNYAKGVIATRLPQGITEETQGANPDRSDAIHIEGKSSGKKMVIENAGRIEAWRNGASAVSLHVMNAGGDALTLTNHKGGVIETRGGAEGTFSSDAVLIDGEGGSKNMEIENAGIIRAGGQNSRAVALLLDNSSSSLTFTNAQGGIISTMPYGGRDASHVAEEHGLYIEAKSASGNIALVNRGRIEVGHDDSEAITIDGTGSSGGIEITQDGVIALYDKDSYGIAVIGGTGKISVNYEDDATHSYVSQTDADVDVNVRLLFLDHGASTAASPNEVNVGKGAILRGGMTTGDGAERLTIAEGGSLTLTNLAMGGGNDSIVNNGRLMLSPQTYSGIENFTQSASGQLGFSKLVKDSHAQLQGTAAILGGTIVIEDDDFYLLLGESRTLLEAGGGLTIEPLSLNLSDKVRSHGQYSLAFDSNQLSVSRETNFSLPSSVVGTRLHSIGDYLDDALRIVEGNSLDASTNRAVQEILTAIADAGGTRESYDDTLNFVSGGIYGSLAEATYLSHQSFGRGVFDDNCHLPLNLFSPNLPDDKGASSFLLFDDERIETKNVGGLPTLPDKWKKKDKVENVEEPVVLWDVSPHRSCEWLAWSGGVTSGKNTDESAGFEERSLFGITGGVTWRPLDESGFAMTIAGNYQTLQHDGINHTHGGEASGDGHRFQGAVGLSHEWLQDDTLYDAMVGLVGGYSNYDIERSLVAPDGTDFKTEGEAELWTVGVRAGGSVRFALSHWFVEPFAHYDWTHIAFQSLSEKGDALSLELGSMDSHLSTVEGGLKAGVRFAIGGGRMMETDVKVSVSRLLHQDGEDGMNSLQALVADGGGGMAHALHIEQTMLFMTAGIKILNGDGLWGSLRYEGLIPIAQDKIVSHRGRLQIYF